MALAFTKPVVCLQHTSSGSSLEPVLGACRSSRSEALSSQPFLLNTANPDIKSIKDFTERDRIAVPSIKVSVQAVLLRADAVIQ